MTETFTRTKPPKKAPVESKTPDEGIGKQKVLQHLMNNPLMAIRELNNRSLHHFLKFMWPEISSEDYQDNWHIPYLCGELQKLAESVAERKRKTYDLIINVPPGTTKTITTMIMLPVWCWTRWHWMRFITLSYSQTLSLESAEYARELIRSERFKAVYPELEIKEDKDQKGNYQLIKKEHKHKGRAPTINRGGNRYSTSVGGTLTGFHGHMILMDDPMNPHQAVSEAELRNTNHWIDQTLPTRKVDKGVTPIVTIMQRLAQGDPTGHQEDKKKKNLKKICLPGEIRNYRDEVKPQKLISEYKDDLLDPKRLDWDVLKDLASDLGQYGYAGQIGQKPTPPTGGMFKVDHFSLVEHAPDPKEFVNIVRYWDKAGTKEQVQKKGGGRGPAYTAGVKMARLKNGKFIVLDVIRGRWSADEREKKIKQTAEADGQETIVWIEQEPASGGKESAQNTIKNLAGFSAYKDQPKGDKIYRADPYSVQVNEGNVLLLKGEWNQPFIEEHRYFPYGTFKDQVDAGGGAFSKITTKRRARALGRLRT